MEYSVTLIQIVVVALVQGITEFLPISSQAHLILLPRVMSWCDQGLVVDIGVHFGTLLAVMAYFWRNCLDLCRGIGSLARGRYNAKARLVFYVFIASVPVFIGGYALWQISGLEAMRSIAVIGWATLCFGVLLWMADKWGLRIYRIEHMTAAKAFMMGCAQVMALIPGTSRAGITMTAARMLGFERTDAARFSLLMAIPAILGAATVGGVELARTGTPMFTTQVALATLISFVTALGAIAAMMRWLDRANFTPFVVYRIALGIALLTAVYGFGIIDASTDTAAIPACIR